MPTYTFFVLSFVSQCWAQQTATAASIAPLPPLHTFVALGPAKTFAACMALADAGWSAWPAAAGSKPAGRCRMAGWGDNDAKDGIPVYMNEQCFCVVNSFVMTRAGTEKMGPWGPVGAGQMAASCPAAWGWSELGRSPGASSSSVRRGWCRVQRKGEWNGTDGRSAAAPPNLVRARGARA